MNYAKNNHAQAN